MNSKRVGSHRVQPRFRLRSAATVWLAALCLSASLTATGYAGSGVPKSVALVSADGKGVKHGPAPSASAAGDASRSGVTDGGGAASSGGAVTATTPQGLLELLSKLLPPGEITGAYQLDGPSIALYVRYTRGNYHSYVWFSVAQVDSEVMKRAGCADMSQVARCTVLPDGAVTRLIGEGSCTSPIQSTMLRPDRVFVMMTVNLCAGYRLPPYPPQPGAIAGSPLRPAEIALLTADDQWNVTMRPELVEAGRRDFPTLRKATLADLL